MTEVLKSTAKPNIFSRSETSPPKTVDYHIIASIHSKPSSQFD